MSNFAGLIAKEEFVVTALNTVKSVADLPRWLSPALTGLTGLTGVITMGVAG